MSTPRKLQGLIPNASTDWSGLGHDPVFHAILKDLYWRMSVVDALRTGMRRLWPQAPAQDCTIR